MKKVLIVILSFLFVGVAAFVTTKRLTPSSNIDTAGKIIDSLNGVYVYDNGSVSNVSGRNITKDGYNLGLKYQCVEFVKRYYYEYLKHKMPDSYGHAKDYFDKSVGNGQKNKKRNLIQYINGNKSKPKQSDIIIFAPTLFNKYGHVAIVSKVTETKIEVIQQNPGPFSSSRETFTLKNHSGNWKINNNRILGWLRKK
jgi:surface antigen